MFNLPWSDLRIEFVKLLAYNAAISLIFSVLVDGRFQANFIYTQCIGFSIYGLVRMSCWLRGETRPGVQDGLAGIPMGFALGIALGLWINGDNFSRIVGSHPRMLSGAAITALVFGAIATYYLHGQTRIQEAEARARAERVRRLEQESTAARTELALLQAQIEPHFLFNTLSNVVGLIDTRPEDARAMLIDLTALLRTSLARTRRTEVTLAEEMNVLRSYLGIMGIRMGKRLSWRVEADEDTLPARLPPLLVQPLVENAIRHGLEPKPGGGSLALRCSRQGDKLLIEVEDGGGGFSGEPGEGVGLANVRRRLDTFYEGAASLKLESNALGGITARLELPWSPK